MMGEELHHPIGAGAKMITDNRREFLKGSLTTAATFAAMPLLNQRPMFAGTDKEMELQTQDKRMANEPMRVSILSYSFHGLLRVGKMDIFGFLESCRYRYQLGAADLWNGFLTSTDEAYLRKVRDGLDERELVVPNLAVDEAHIWEDDAALRQKNYENAKAHLNAGRILGARFVRVDAGGPRTAKEWTNEAFDHIVKRYKEYAQYAYDHGFKAGAESHWGPENYWPTMKRLYKAVDHPGFGICCHVNSWQGTQEEKDIADREAAPLIVHTHFSWNITEGPLVEKMTNLRNAGYQGYYSVEHYGGKEEYAEVSVQLAKIRAVLQSWRAGGTGTPTLPRPQ